MGIVNMLPDDVIARWRSSFSSVNGTKPKRLPKRPGTLNVVAVMSCPRLGWTDTWGSINESFHALGIHVAKHTGAFWAQGLTKLMEDAVAIGMDYIITVDYDSIFDRNHVGALVNLIDSHPTVDAICTVQVRREQNSSMFSLRDDEGNFRTGEIDLTEFDKPLTQIATGHFGLTIIRASSLVYLPKPWFMAIPNGQGEWKNGQIDDDVYFWLNVETVKWKVCLANQIRIGHIQNMVSWPGMHFTPEFQYMTDWNQKGQP